MSTNNASLCVKSYFMDNLHFLLLLLFFQNKLFEVWFNILWIIWSTFYVPMNNKPGLLHRLYNYTNIYKLLSNQADFGSIIRTHVLHAWLAGQQRYLSPVTNSTTNYCFSFCTLSLLYIIWFCIVLVCCDRQHLSKSCMLQHAQDISECFVITNALIALPYSMDTKFTTQTVCC